MRFDLDDDERALQAAIRDLCRSADAPDHPRAAASPGAVDADNWRSLAEAGIFSLRLPEPDGAGLGMSHAAVVFEELGRANVPGPLVATHLAAGSRVPGAADGRRLVGVAERSDRPVLLEHAEALDAVVVVDDDDVSVIERETVSFKTIAEPLDPLTPVSVAGELPRGEPIGGREEARRWRLEGALLTAAMQVGLSAAATDAAVAYAKERHQFGRPIGSFQAVKHLCADMLVRAEVARVAVHAAAVRLDEGADAARAIAGAKLLADDAAFRNGKDCIQVHGGMGFTWEANVHLYVKRAAVLRTHFLSGAARTEAVAETL